MIRQDCGFNNHPSSSYTSICQHFTQINSSSSVYNLTRKAKCVKAYIFYSPKPLPSPSHEHSTFWDVYDTSAYFGHQHVWTWNNKKLWHRKANKSKVNYKQIKAARETLWMKGESSSHFSGSWRALQKSYFMLIWQTKCSISCVVVSCFSKQWQQCPSKLGGARQEKKQ